MFDTRAPTLDELLFIFIFLSIMILEYPLMAILLYPELWALQTKFSDLNKNFVQH